jgi:hypothetical protein
MVRAGRVERQGHPPTGCAENRKIDQLRNPNFGRDSIKTLLPLPKIIIEDEFADRVTR